MPYDLIIKNCTVIDGTGDDRYTGSVGVKDGLIAKIWRGEPTDNEAAETVYGEGRILCPGFVDIHSHSDTTILRYPEAESRILQGITTELGGNCGISAAPVNPRFRDSLEYYLRESLEDGSLEWESFDEYLRLVEKKKPSVNIGSLVGHGSLRIAVMGFSADRPDRGQMGEMKRRLKEALEDGAFGMSSGLIYPPGSYADEEELTELARELPAYRAIYSTHMRNEGLMLIPALEEAIRLGRESGAFVEISHHKETRKELWRDAVIKSVGLMKSARESGVKIAFDQYPYRASATSLDSNVSEWAFEGGREKLFERLRDPVTRKILVREANESHTGRWGDIFISYAFGKNNLWTVGKSVEEIASIRGTDPAEACFDLILASEGRVNEVNYGMCEEDIEFIMSQDFGVIGSDGEAKPLNCEGQPHPRNFGTFPRVIAHYCRERKLFSLEKAINKLTLMPAERMGLRDRGLIKEGMCADMVIFDFERINDTPSYDRPKQACEGIERVYVNGVLTALNGRHTGAAAGRVLRRGR